MRATAARLMGFGPSSHLVRVGLILGAAALTLVPRTPAHAQTIGTGFSGPVTADGSSAFFNAAAMAEGRGTHLEVDLGLSVVQLAYDPSGPVASSEAVVVAPVGTVGGFTDAIHPRVHAGISLAIPHRSGGGWTRDDDAAAITRYYLVSASVFHITATPAVSYTPVDWLSLGVSLTLAHGRLTTNVDKDLGAQLNRTAGSTEVDSPFPFASPTFAASTTLATSGWGVGVGGGVVVRPTEHLSIGAGVQSPITVRTEGNVSVEYPPDIERTVEDTLPGAELPELAGLAEVALEVPLSVYAGASLRPSPEWALTAEYTFQLKSAQPSLDVDIVEATSASIADTQKVQAYRDRHGVRLRGVFTPVPMLDLGLLFTLETNSVPTEVYTPVNLDYTKLRIGAMARWRVSEHVALLLDYAHVFLVPVDVESSLYRPLSQPSLSAFSLPAPTGRYTGSADQLQLGVAISFGARAPIAEEPVHPAPVDTPTDTPLDTGPDPALPPHTFPAPPASMPLRPFAAPPPPSAPRDTRPPSTFPAPPGSGPPTTMPPGTRPPSTFPAPFTPSGG
jgi:long-subunit fatty acid transport protein